VKKAANKRGEDRAANGKGSASLCSMSHAIIFIKNRKSQLKLPTPPPSSPTDAPPDRKVRPLASKGEAWRGRSDALGF
jgi:hypothetical protein